MGCSFSGSGMPCHEGTNPRYAGKCYRCGRPIPKPPPAVRRNLDLERKLVEGAAQGYCDPDALIQFAQMRAWSLCGEYVDDPMLIQPGRDRPKDGREELADFVNHMTMEIQEHFGAERNEFFLNALRLVALAYDQMLKAQDA